MNGSADGGISADYPFARVRAASDAGAAAAHWAGVCVFSLLSPSLSVTLSIDETSRPTILRSGVTGLLEASVGRWLRFLIEAVPPRHGHIMPELARDMRQKRAFSVQDRAA